MARELFGVGAARDVIQNHLLQLLALTAMEEPVELSSAGTAGREDQGAFGDPADGAARPHHRPRPVHRGWQGGEKVVGLLDEEGFSKTSTTETFAAITLDVDTRRWAGVPFYLRTGKRLGRRVTEIALIFKRAPHLPFDATMTEELGQNALVIRVQPDEGITLRFGSKVPGNAWRSATSTWTSPTARRSPRTPRGLRTADPRRAARRAVAVPGQPEVELSWEILDPALDNWASHGKPDPYESGGWGPGLGVRDVAPIGPGMEAAVRALARGAEGP